MQVRLLLGAPFEVQVPVSTKDNELLGGNFSAARRELHKKILYALIVALELNRCFRCGLSIDKEEDLSIEHKVSWRLSKTPKETFFDLNNIAFSHISCNSAFGDRDKAAQLKKLITHCPKGHPYTVANTYMKNGKRNCRECARQASREWRERQRAQ